MTPLVRTKDGTWKLSQLIRLRCSEQSLRRGLMDNSLFDQTFRDNEGNIVIAQPPNLPLLVGVTSSLLALVIPNGDLSRGFGTVAFGALFTWAWLELFEGVNYFRRGLGLFTLLGLIAWGFSFSL